MRGSERTAADLAALAGAAKVLLGPDVVCAAVVRVAVANGGDVESCSVVGTDVLVMVGVRVGNRAFRRLRIRKGAGSPVEEVGVVPG